MKAPVGKRTDREANVHWLGRGILKQTWVSMSLLIIWSNIGAPLPILRNCCISKQVQHSLIWASKHLFWLISQSSPTQSILLCCQLRGTASLMGSTSDENWLTDMWSMYPTLTPQLLFILRMSKFRSRISWPFSLVSFVTLSWGPLPNAFCTVSLHIWHENTPLTWRA